jgi:hypothetical protein
VCSSDLALVAREIGEAERKQKARRVAQKFYPLLPRTRVVGGSTLRFRVGEEDDGEEAAAPLAPTQQKRTFP